MCILLLQAKEHNQGQRKSGLSCCCGMRMTDAIMAVTDQSVLI